MVDHKFDNNECECGAVQKVVLVTDASKLVVGDKIVIVAKNSNVALSTTQNTNNRGQATVTKNGNTLTFGSDVQIIVLEVGTTNNTFAFKVENSYLYAASKSSNHLKTKSEIDNYFLT